MNLLERLQKLLDEDEWRQKKAQQYSSGLGSLPYSFQEQAQLRSPLLMDMFRKQDADALKSEGLWNKMDAPEHIPQRFYLNEGIKLQEERKRKREQLGV